MIELVGVLPLLACIAVLLVQSTLLAITACLAQVAVGRAATGAARSEVGEVLPPPWHGSVRVEPHGAEVRVRLSAPALVPGTERWLVVRAQASVAAS